MDYIRYHEAERLFAAWPILEDTLERLLKSTELIDKKTLMGAADDCIYSLCIGNKALNDMPPTGQISDSTCNIAISYKKIMYYNQESIKSEIDNEILELSLTIDKLNIAFRRLTPIQQTILRLLYWESKSIVEVMEYMKQEKRNINNLVS